MVFYQGEYQRLTGELERARDESQLRGEVADETRAALSDLLVRLRLQGLG